MSFHAFPRVPGEHLVCFDVANFEEALARDPFAIERFERDAGHHGFVAARVDVPTKTICVSVTDPSLTDAEVAAAVAAFGFEVYLAKEGHSHGEERRQRRSS
jgi:hypothetical protein